jgi:hypothetical protein
LVIRPASPVAGAADSRTALRGRRPSLTRATHHLSSCLRRAEIELGETLRIGKASIWTIRPLVTVNAITEITRPRGATTAPAAPFASAARIVITR